MHPILPDTTTHVRTASISRMPRLILLSTILLVTLVVLVPRLTQSDILGADDFIEYWAAGRLNSTGDNPYAADELLVLQLQEGWDEVAPLMMWNPPPVLTLIMPFGLLNYGIARLLWLFINLALVMTCAEVLWRFYAGEPKHRIWGLLASLAFYPTLSVLHIGQIGIWVLVGVVAFTILMHQNRWGAAGAFLILLTLKPHVAYLVWAALGLWWLRRRAWGLVGGFALALLITWLVPVLVNPQVTSQYIEAVRNAPPLYWKTATIGFLLRQWFGWEKEWLQFIPSLAGLGWLLWYWSQRAATWEWKREMPLLLLVSTTTMSFGWPFDLVILLPVVVQIMVWALADPSVWYRISTLAFYVSFSGLVIWQHQSGAGLHDFVWLAPALLLFYLFVRGRQNYLLTTGGFDRVTATD